MLVDGVEGHARIPEENRLRAIAVMDIEIKDRHAFRAGGKGFQSCDGNAVQVAEAHRALPNCVMPWRTHEAERHLPFPREVQTLQGATDGTSGVPDDVRVGRCIAVEILRRRLHSREVFLRVRAKDHFVGHVRDWSGPIEHKFTLAAQLLDSLRHALRAFRMPCAVVGGAAFVGDNLHRSANHPEAQGTRAITFPLRSALLSGDFHRRHRKSGAGRSEISFRFA